jgi:hypothetical protein
MPSVADDFVSEHAALIGRVAIAWNDLNYILSYLFQIFTGMPKDRATAIYFTPKSDATQRELLMAAAKIALEPYPEIWQAFKSSFDKIKSFAGERNAAIHTSWAVTFPEPRFVPASTMPIHGSLKPDFASQFASLREKLANEFFALNEVRKEFERVSGVSGDSKRDQIALNAKRRGSQIGDGEQGHG